MKPTRWQTKNRGKLTAQALNVSLSAKTEGGSKPIVTGVTNLPDGTDLMITISRTESQYMAQDKVKVKAFFKKEK